MLQPALALRAQIHDVVPMVELTAWDQNFWLGVHVVTESSTCVTRVYTVTEIV